VYLRINGALDGTSIHKFLMGVPSKFRKLVDEKIEKDLDIMVLKKEFETSVIKNKLNRVPQTILFENEFLLNLFLDSIYDIEKIQAKRHAVYIKDLDTIGIINILGLAEYPLVMFEIDAYDVMIVMSNITMNNDLILGNEINKLGKEEIEEYNLFLESKNLS